MNVSGPKSIRVLIVEDSQVVLEFLTHILSADPSIQVVGTAADGTEALEAVRRTKPHVITMDIHMPRVDGYEATRNIMTSCPTPIVIVSSSVTTDAVATNFRALEAGALAVVARPSGIGHMQHAGSVKELVDTVKLMSEVKVVRRWTNSKPLPAVAAQPRPAIKTVAAPEWPIQVVAIGTSTGGPQTLLSILMEIPRDFPVPILIVQHMTPGFTQGFVDWLADTADFPVKVATAGEAIQPGQAYVAPDDQHMGISRHHRITLSREGRENGMRPSVSYLFRSVGAAVGQGAVAVILTGMGVDGGDELKRLKDQGAITIAQDEESCIVNGMPGQAVKLGAATYVLSPRNIAKALLTLVTKS